MDNSKIRIQYGTDELEFDLPAGWNLLGNPKTKYLPPIDTDDMIQALKQPLGKPPLEEMAKDKKNAVIITSDVTRPLSGEKALPLLLNSLNRAGISDSNILLIMGGGTHQPPQDLHKAYLKKYGEEVVGRVKIMYHNPDNNLVSLGKTKSGHIVEIDKWVVEADLRIAFDGILPHALAGYSAGAKSILPAVASREAIIQNHLMVTDPGVGMGLIKGNPIRAEMEEIAEMVGLDFIFNLILNAEGEPVGAVSGDFRQAYYHGIAIAKQIYQAKIPRPAEVVFTTGYPFDIHFYQSLNGVCSSINACKDGGTIIHLTPAYEGVRTGTKKLFAAVNAMGYKELFARLKGGERHDESVRSFFYPEINIGLAMNIFRAMIDRNIRIIVVTNKIPTQELQDMGFEHADTLEKAVTLVHQRMPVAGAAAAFSAKVIISVDELD